MTEAQKKTKKSFKHYSHIIYSLAPLIGLILVVVILGILTEGKLLTSANLKNISNQVIITALVSIGAVFVFGMGNFDLSLGSGVLLSAVVGTMVAVATGNLFLTFIVCLLVSGALAFLKGLFSAYVEIPFFIFTIVLATVISAFVLLIMGDETTLYLRNAVHPIPTFDFTQMSIINIIALVAYFGLCIILFNFTSLGNKVKMVGGNKRSAKQSGISFRNITLITFLVSAIGIAIAAFLLIIRVRTIGTTTAGSTGTDVMIALVLGGMPISGGPKSRITAGLLGAVTISVLNSGLTILGLSSGTIQLVRGIIFIIVVLVASFSYRTKLLPR